MKQKVIKTLTIPVFLALAPLVRRNYRLRKLGVLPDQWYWADRLLAKLGHFA